MKKLIAIALLTSSTFLPAESVQLTCERSMEELLSYYSSSKYFTKEYNKCKSSIVDYGIKYVFSFDSNQLNNEKINVDTIKYRCQDDKSTHYTNEMIVVHNKLQVIFDNGSYGISRFNINRETLEAGFENEINFSCKLKYSENKKNKI